MVSWNVDVCLGLWLAETGRPIGGSDLGKRLKRSSFGICIHGTKRDRKLNMSVTMFQGNAKPFQVVNNGGGRAASFITPRDA